MSEIKINVDALADCINELKSLKSECEGLNTAPPVTVGGGNVVNELESIANVYLKLNESVIDMISNTASFMENVKTSFEKSDKYTGV